MARKTFAFHPFTSFFYRFRHRAACGEQIQSAAKEHLKEARSRDVMKELQNRFALLHGSRGDKNYNTPFHSFSEGNTSSLRNFLIPVSLDASVFLDSSYPDF